MLVVILGGPALFSLEREERETLSGDCPSAESRYACFCSPL
jgi:hypothetical protein